ncbi:MAG: PKD domain-containing protein, partial [Desulfobacteraceae bacterium]|nr:PKD domain-containing protein [Desulfobacteraceae bacterium]
MLNPFGCIDLTGSRVRADKSGYPDSVKITARFGNGGALHIAPGAAMSFYDGDPKAGGTLLGTVVTTRQLNPGEYEDLSLTLDSPQVGILAVYAVADDDGTGTGGVSETDEENNTASGEFHIGNHDPVITSKPVTEKVTLEYGTGTFSQEGKYTPDQSVDGQFDNPVINGWAVLEIPVHVTHEQTAVWETATDLAAGQLKFRMYFYHPSGSAALGRFRISVTTDDRSEFADDKNSDGDITADWTVLANPSVTLPDGATSQVLSDSSILIGGTVVSQAVYEIEYTTSVFGITGIRLEALEDSSLPHNGPGMHPDNGNFQLTELELYKVQSGLEAEFKAGSGTYVYNVTAYDPDGDTLTYTLKNSPDGMTVDPATGVITWTPTDSQTGIHNVSVEVSDGKDGTDIQHYTLRVLSPIDAYPIISGNPVVGSELTFTVSDPSGLTCEWDFGDGYTATGSEAVHTYAAQGNYSIVLHVADSEGNSADIPRFLNIGTANAPTASMSVSGYMTAGQTISFDGSGSYAQSGMIQSWNWNFGDGHTGSGSEVSHIYSDAGTYQAVLTVTDTNGLSSSASVSLPIGPNQGPVAGFGYSGVMADGNPITFDASGSYDPEGQGLSYAWDFGDGSTGTGVTPVHTFAAVGDYAVTLTVTDSQGQTASASRTMSIGSSEGPLAKFTVSGAYSVGKPISFDGSLSSGDIASYSWDFGDGTTITGVQAEHTYTEGGEYTAVLRVTGTSGAWSEAHAKMTVSDRPNQNPAVQITCPAKGIVNENAVFSAAGTDPDGDTLVYSWNFGDGTSGTGASAGHAYVSAGIYDITVTVSDGYGGEASDVCQTEIIELPAYNVAPEAEAGGPYTGGMDQAVVFDGSGSYDLNLDTITYSWDFGNGETGSGISPSYTWHDAGTYTVTLTVTDPEGLAGTDTAEVRIADPDDSIPPELTLDMDCPDVYDLYAVTGSVSDDSSVSYKLQSREKGASEWITFAQGSGASVSGELGVFDPTVLRNGIHEIRLYAEDLSGNASAMTTCAVVDGGLKVGQVTMGFEDMSFPDMGFPLSFTREYDSRAQGPGDFGPGWNLPQKEVKAAVTNVLGEGWTQQMGPGRFGIPVYYLLETQRHVVAIRFSDTDVMKFDMTVEPAYSEGLPFEHSTPPVVTFKALDQTQGTLEALGYDSEVTVYDNVIMGYSGSNIDIYNPVRFRYTRPDGTVYVIHTENGIESITDQYGRTVTYDDDGIYNSSGASITFDRDPGDSRIKRVDGPNGRGIEYSYDENGTLSQVVMTGSESLFDRMMGNYGYKFGMNGKRVLEEIKAPDGTVLGSFIYDSRGRMTGLIDGNGREVIYGYNVPSHTQVMTDRRGYETVYEYDYKGNVTGKEDPMGNVTEWTYDDNGYADSEILTDINGETVSHKTFENDDRGNKLFENVHLTSEGKELTTGYTYNSRNKVVTVTDPKGKTTTNFYDDKGNLERTEEPEDMVTVYTYHDNGNLKTYQKGTHPPTISEYYDNDMLMSETDSLGNITEFTYYPDGKTKTETKYRTTEDENGNPVSVKMVTRYEYDVKGRLTKTVDPYENEEITEYDPVTGKESARVDKNKHRTEYEYDGNGNLTYAWYVEDGTFEHYTYDGEGNQLTFTDRSGNITGYAYDELSRNTDVWYCGEADICTEAEAIHKTGTEYDAFGNITATTDENGVKTECSYDEAGRNNVIRQFHNDQVLETFYTYDDNSKLKTVIDANIHTTTYEYDDLNRRVKTIFHDGSYTEVSYNSQGLKEHEYAQALPDQTERIITRYEYDAAGRLEKVINDFGGPDEMETAYEYDEIGNKISQTDPNTHITQWIYDHMGRVTKHTLPEDMSESFTYYPNGEVKTRTDFNDNTTTFAYYSYGKLKSKTFQDGSSVSCIYTPDGRTDTVTDTRGITDHDYDFRGRLSSVLNPDGTEISYTYYPDGSRKTVAVPSGTTTYTYDDLNRLETVAGPDGLSTFYTYDSAGNRKSMIYPNGNVTEYEYNALNRLKEITTRNSDSEIIARYSYGLGAVGNRTGVEDHTGRLVSYTYDNLLRLEKETVTDPNRGNSEISYAYDTFGNRLSKTDSDGTTTYHYDDNDRLYEELHSSGTVTTYTYDDNGNMSSKSVDSDLTVYSYDYEDRLTGVESSNAQIAYAYDTDGIRVASDADGVITQYLVDKNRPYAQVLEERDSFDQLAVSYIYGDDLVSQHREGSAYYYLYDGQMSARQLADDTGAAINTYVYDAFGITLDKSVTVANNYLYTGEQYDPNLGLYYLRARYYDQSVGRFITTDPYKGNIYEPSTLHRYLYCRNNPINAIDPSGENDSLTKVGAVMTIILSLLTISGGTGALYLLDENYLDGDWHSSLTKGSLDKDSNQQAASLLLKRNWRGIQLEYNLQLYIPKGMTLVGTTLGFVTPDKSKQEIISALTGSSIKTGFLSSQAIYFQAILTGLRKKIALPGKKKTKITTAEMKFDDYTANEDWTFGTNGAFSLKKGKLVKGDFYIPFDILPAKK